MTVVVTPTNTVVEISATEIQVVSVGIQGEQGIQGNVGGKGADIASANDITLTTGFKFDITGTTDINTIDTAGIIEGTEIILHVDDGLTFKHNVSGAGASLLLSDSEDFVAAAGSNISLYLNNSVWEQRSKTTP